MQIFTHWNDLPASAKGGSAVIGNFDGVHRGHQAVLDIARKRAKDNDIPLGVLTFDPHPRQFFAPDAPEFRLMNNEAKANRLAKLGVDYLYQLPFDKIMSSFTAREFAKTVIAEGLGLSHIVIGADFCFGKGRLGTAQDLVDFGTQFGFDVTIAPLLKADSDYISSTSIRRALAEGDPAIASDMLGHWHRIEGEVIHGEKRGRELGFPTANMSVKGLHLPKFGVYAVFATILDGPYQGVYQGAASLGIRPMFGENTPNLETYLFDFDGDLYGTHISIALVEYLRGEEKFDGLDALIDQMTLDCDRARKVLANA
ncbi:Riboflavin kinase / FAD synthetase = FMN adenylyltransferase, RibF [Rhodobacterales bacterium HTCC2150]|nr:Riboflavin kinase / FAD synthetase = FMN adenylyltransferase, RibF [Rhodobacterales bacterium HTCC2150] [Rhodobacteraceae bacterium HTCC2150]